MYISKMSGVLISYFTLWRLQRQKETDTDEKYAQQEGHGALDEYHLHLSSPRYR